MRKRGTQQGPGSRRTRKNPDGVLGALITNPALKAHVQVGKRGLAARHRRCVEELAGRVVDSLDFDSAMQDLHPNESRWDYVMGIAAGRAERVLAAEIHPASAGEIASIVAKKSWSEPVLADAGVVVRLWYWLATDAGVAFRRGGAEERRLALAGIQFPTRILSV